MPYRWRIIVRRAHFVPLAPSNIHTRTQLFIWLPAWKLFLNLFSPYNVHARSKPREVSLASSARTTLFGPAQLAAKIHTFSHHCPPSKPSRSPCASGYWRRLHRHLQCQSKMSLMDPFPYTDASRFVPCRPRQTERMKPGGRGRLIRPEFPRLMSNKSRPFIVSSHSLHDGNGPLL